MTFTQSQIQQALDELPKENRPVMTAIVGQLQAKVKQLEQKDSDDSWVTNPDRMGGQFTEEEIRRAGEWR